ncbi:hypothetical protein TNCV_3257161 [Trichonephila clavipes]|nr:hypothetical protein TNCV_3257161 [Trichonephila clavipes]
MGTWRSIADTTKLASFLAIFFGDLVTIQMLLEPTGKVYNNAQELNIHCSLGVRTVRTVLNPLHDAGLDKSGVFHSAEWHDGVIGRAMKSGSCGYGSSFEWKVLEFFGLAESLEVAL